MLFFLFKQSQKKSINFVIIDFYLVHSFLNPLIKILNLHIYSIYKKRVFGLLYFYILYLSRFLLHNLTTSSTVIFPPLSFLRESFKNHSSLFFTIAYV